MVLSYHMGPKTELRSLGSMASVLMPLPVEPSHRLLLKFFHYETESPQKEILIPPKAVTSGEQQISPHPGKGEHAEGTERVPAMSRLVNQSIDWDYLQERG